MFNRRSSYEGVDEGLKTTIVVRQSDGPFIQKQSLVTIKDKYPILKQF